MRHRFLGFICALATLIVIYVASWITDLGGLGGVMDDDGYPFSIIIVPVFAAIVSNAVLFAFVLPQTLLARFIVRRFSVHWTIAFLVFLGVSSVLILPVALWHSRGSPWVTFVWGVVYLLAGCSVLWSISFGHDRAT